MDHPTPGSCLDLTRQGRRANVGDHHLHGNRPRPGRDRYRLALREGGTASSCHQRHDLGRPNCSRDEQPAQGTGSPNRPWPSDGCGRRRRRQAPVGSRFPPFHAGTLSASKSRTGAPGHQDRGIGSDHRERKRTCAGTPHVTGQLRETGGGLRAEDNRPHGRRKELHRSETYFGSGRHGLHHAFGRSRLGSH